MAARDLRVLGAIVVLPPLLAACSELGPAKPTTTFSPSATSAAPEARSVVTQAYVSFWDVSNRVVHDDAVNWRQELSTVAAEPQLSRMVTNLGNLQSRSIAVYGTTQEHVTKVDIDHDPVTVTDCQDASQSGQEDAWTHERRTVGIPRNPVSAHMQRGADGRWRVAEIIYPGGTC